MLSQVNLHLRQTLLVVAASLLLHSLAWSQDFMEQLPLRSSGNIPDLYTNTRFSGENAWDINDYSMSDDKNRYGHKYFKAGEYVVSNLLNSGMVLFNDPVGEYVNKVADIALASQPTLRDSVQIFVVKSSSVNAFTSSNGIIMVTLGLIAQLETEAQLGFIICHEASHYKLGHTIDDFLDEIEYKQMRTINQNQATLNKLLQKMQFAHEKEYQADEHGLILYNKSQYSPRKMLNVFDVLLYGYLPFDEVTFPATYFDSEHYKIPQTYFETDSNEISAEDDVDDKFSTHPNIKKRREKLVPLLKDQEIGDKRQFIIGQEEFVRARDIARFEVCRIDFLDMDYGKSLYHCFLLLEKYPDNLFLKKIFGQSLFYLSVYKFENEQGKVLTRYRRIEGSSQRLYYFLHKLSDKECTVLATRYLYQLHKDSPDDDVIKKFYRSALYTLVNDNDMKPEQFYRTLKPEVDSLAEIMDEQDSIALDPHAVPVPDEDFEMSKYDKIRAKKRQPAKKVVVDQEMVEDLPYYTFAFLKFENDTTFWKDFDWYFHNKKDDPAWYEQDYSYNTKPGYVRFVSIKDTLSKLVLVNPLNMQIDLKTKNKFGLINSDQERDQFIQKVMVSGKAADVDIINLDNNRLLANATEQFNDYTLLNEWLIARMDHGQNFVSHIEEEKINALIQKYNTKYFMWSGIMKVKENKLNDVYACCLYTSLGFTLPIGIYYLVRPNIKSYYYFFIFDIDSADAIVVFDREKTGNYGAGRMKSLMHSTFLKINDHNR